MILGQERPFIEWDWISRNIDEIGQATVEHFTHTALAVSIGLVLSFGLSLAALRWRQAYAPITWVTGVLYTIPSIALFTFLVPIFGLNSLLTSQIALVSYTLLILIRNIVAGVRGVPEQVTEASRGMGMTDRRIFLSIKLPLALPAIIAGVRVAAVTTIGLVTLTVLVGQGGYGLFILRGISRQFLTEALVGTSLSVMMAVVVDTSLAGLERLVTPWNRSASGT
ncbi:MAG: ABC transporter permease [Acidimicrobiia bacterium]